MEGMGEDAGTRYSRLCDEVAALALRAGRLPTDIGIVAVTKAQPAEALWPLYRAGCRDMGESRLQEALPKKELLSGAVAIRWHLIGTLQKNKVSKAVGAFSLVHSVDSLALATKLAAASLHAGCTTSILLQVNTSHEASKHGFAIEALPETLAAILLLPGLAVHGLMTMAPADAPVGVTATCFAALRTLRDSVATPTLPLPLLSMGMSDDYPIAIAEGATLLRIGSKLF